MCVCEREREREIGDKRMVGNTVSYIWYTYNMINIQLVIINCGGRGSNLYIGP